MASFNNTTNRNNRNKISTTTKIIQLYNDKAGEDSSTMRLGLWNDYASVNINPMLPKSEQVDGKVYNYEKTASILLSIDNLVQIQTGIRLLEKEIKNEKTTGKPRKVTSIGTRNNDVVVKIGHAGEYEGIDDFYLALFSLADDGSVDGNAFYIFTNPDDGLLLNYNEDEGTFKNRHINTQWEEFKFFVDYCVSNLLNGAAHGANKNLDYHGNKLFTTIETIKALVENLLSNGGGSSETKNKGGFGGNSGGFSGSRRRRSSISLSDEDVTVEDDEEDFMKIPEGVDEEYEFDSEETVKKPSKKSSKKGSSSSGKKSSKKSSKKISVDDIASDMDDELDDMGDID